MGGVAVTTYETTAYFKLPDDFKFQCSWLMGLIILKTQTQTAQLTPEQYAPMLKKTSVCRNPGTALENNVDEMVNLIDILRSDIAKQISRMKMLSSAPQFREKVATVYYRRKKMFNRASRAS